MVEETGNHSPDLEWMLLSQQVDDEVIIDHLVREYYPRIYQLAASRLVYPKYAQRASQEVITRAVLGSKSYPPNQTIDAWLEALTDQVVSEQHKHLSEQQLLNSRLISALGKRKPLGPPESWELDQVKEKILYGLHQSSAAGRKKAQHQEFLLVAITLLVFVIILQYSSFLSRSLSQSAPGENLDMPLNQRAGLLPEDLGEEIRSSYYASWRLPDQAPLDIESSHDEIWRRVLMSRYTWSSLWVDVSLVLHGPEEYTGPPLVERHQVWLSAEQDGLHLSGDPAGEEVHVEKITASSSGPGPLSLLHGHDDFTRLGSQVPWFYLSSEWISSSPYMTNFFFVADYDFPPHRVNFRAVEETTWAGRPVLIVQAINNAGELQAALWLDTETGLALREQFFSGSSGERVRLETIVERVKFNPTFPAGLLEGIISGDQEATFASDFRGEPQKPGDQPGIYVQEEIPSQAIPSAMLPTERFKPDNSQLAFISPGPGDKNEAGQIPVLLYADEYLLGEILLEDPRHSICARSSAGGQIVISQWSQSPEKLASTVTWYDLSDMTSKMIRVPGVTITRLAFSPDAAYIAAAGLIQRNGASQLYLIHTDTGEIEYIRGLNNVWSIAWNPDGTRLAGLSIPSFRIYTSWKLRIVTYDIAARAIRTTLVHDDFSWGSSSIEIPLPEWTASFPLTMHGLEPCAESPIAMGAD